MSAPPLRHYGIIRGGKVLLHNLALYSKNLLALEGKSVEITIKEKFEDTSVDQHAYYRGAIIESALQTECFGGWTADEVHQELTHLYLGYDRQVNYKRRDGTIVSRIVREVPSTASIGKKKMAEYIDHCIRHLANEGIEVFSPEQYKLTKFKTKNE